MIDLHCHVDLYPNPAAVIQRVSREGMYVLAVTTTPEAWHGTQVLASHARGIEVGLGLHPGLVAERHKEVALVCALLADTKFVGEIGLDGSPAHKATLDLQCRVLDRILDSCTAHGGRVMTLHSRGAASLVLDVLEAHPAAGRPVLHWFSGTRAELERAVKLDCWFSVGPAMLRSRKGTALLEAMPKDRVLTETDGPFATLGSAPLMPWDVTHAVRKLVELWDRSPLDVERVLQSNLRALLRQGPLPS